MEYKIKQPDEFFLVNFEIDDNYEENVKTIESLKGNDLDVECTQVYGVYDLCVRVKYEEDKKVDFTNMIRKFPFVKSYLRMHVVKDHNNSFYRK